MRLPKGSQASDCESTAEPPERTVAAPNTRYRQELARLAGLSRFHNRCNGLHVSRGGDVSVITHQRDHRILCSISSVFHLDTGL